MIVRYGYYLAASGVRVGDDFLSSLAEKSWRAFATPSPQRCEGVSLWADDKSEVTLSRTIRNFFTGKYEVNVTRSQDLKGLTVESD